MLAADKAWPVCGGQLARDGAGRRAIGELRDQPGAAAGSGGDGLLSLLDRGAQAALEPAGGVGVDQVACSGLIEAFGCQAELGCGFIELASNDGSADLPDLGAQSTAAGTVAGAAFFALAETLIGCGSVWHSGIGEAGRKLPGKRCEVRIGGKRPK